ncbi:DUF2846 domain-containing protein [Myxococcota bacterium]|nr:DUF2846 domain-containing protein [Myxococcota bacterium]
MKTRFFPVFGVIFLLSACHSYTLASKSEDARAKMFYIPQQRANIYIYRNEILGAAIGMKLMIDSVPIAQTGPKTYVKVSVLPGPHTVISIAEDTSVLHINAQVGENYFVWQEAKMGLWTIRSRLHLMNEFTGRRGVMQCRLIQSSQP